MIIRLYLDCTYTVDGEYDVPDDIAQDLLKCESIEWGSPTYDWLSDHIRQHDANDWKFYLGLAEES